MVLEAILRRPLCPPPGMTSAFGADRALCEYFPLFSIFDCNLGRFSISMATLVDGFSMPLLGIIRFLLDPLIVVDCCAKLLLKPSEPPPP